MTLAATTVQNSYIGNGSSNSFPFTFPLFETADVTVQVVSPSITYTLVQGVDYTVVLNPTGADQYLGGSVTLANNGKPWLSAGFLAAGWTINIMRIMALTQNTSIRNQGSFYPETIEDALDYITMICQQLNAGLGTSGGGSGGGGTTVTSLILNDLSNGHTYLVVSENGVIGLELNS